MSMHQARDHVTGQFAHDGDFERTCVCGHALGIHLHGGFDCISADIGDGSSCGCTRFRKPRAKRSRIP